MDVFEFVMEELKSLHDENELKNLEKVSESYYRANLENNHIEECLAKVLSKEEMITIHKLCDNFLTKEVVAGNLYYNQGFSDAIRLIIHLLIWNPMRR
ncbi:MAG: hypothetical protein H6Q70_617 [Firmicutes bacterium]|nr:hypothetical protein [Bacillota bacterium]